MRLATQRGVTLASLLAALPDAGTALAYLFTWFAPLAYRPDAVKYLLMMMLLEFLVVHSGGFLGMTWLSDDTSRRAKTMGVFGFGLFYLLFAGGFSLGFHTWWPLVTFGWLLAAKFAQIWLAPLPRAEEKERQIAFWAFSVVAYLGAVFAGVMLPIPQFGITHEVIAGLALPGSGLWIEHPQTVIASGTIYFSLLAIAKAGYRPEWLSRFHASQAT